MELEMSHWDSSSLESPDWRHQEAWRRAGSRQVCRVPVCMVFHACLSRPEKVCSINTIVYLINIDPGWFLTHACCGDTHIHTWTHTGSISPPSQETFYLPAKITLVNWAGLTLMSSVWDGVGVSSCWSLSNWTEKSLIYFLLGVWVILSRFRTQLELLTAEQTTHVSNASQGHKWMHVKHNGSRLKCESISMVIFLLLLPASKVCVGVNTECPLMDLIF